MILTKKQKEKEHKEDTLFTEINDDDVEFIEEDEGVPHITHVNNILHSILSNANLQFQRPLCSQISHFYQFQKYIVTLQGSLAL